MVVSCVALRHKDMSLCLSSIGVCCAADKLAFHRRIGLIHSTAGYNVSDVALLLQRPNDMCVLATDTSESMRSDSGSHSPAEISREQLW